MVKKNHNGNIDCPFASARFTLFSLSETKKQIRKMVFKLKKSLDNIKIDEDLIEEEKDKEEDVKQFESQNELSSKLFPKSK